MKYLLASSRAKLCLVRWCSRTGLPLSRISMRDNRHHSPQNVVRIHYHLSSPVSIQMQSLALRALRKRTPQETQKLASSQSWLPLLRPSIPIGWRLRLLREALAFLAVFVYATHATQAIVFEWKPGFRLLEPNQDANPRLLLTQE